MATSTRASPPPPAPATAAVITDPGKERTPFLPAPENDGEEKEKPLAHLASATAVANLHKPGNERCSCLPTPEEEVEEKEKPLTIAPIAQPGKKMRVPLVPMTDQEQEKLMELKQLHRSGIKELQKLAKTREKLFKNRDEILFRRRCLAARFVNQIVLHRLDAAYAQHQLLLGIKVGDRVPEELIQARDPIRHAIYDFVDMARIMNIGMDNFLVEYHNFQKKRRMQNHENKVETEAVCDQSRTPLAWSCHSNVGG